MKKNFLSVLDITTPSQPHLVFNDVIFGLGIFKRRSREEEGEGERERMELCCLQLFLSLG